MALDHYVSQVHLKNFYSPEKGDNMVYAIRKADLKCFPCRAEDVCRIENGSTNDYLLESRAIEKFLESVEPAYNKSVEKFRSGRIDNESIFVIAGFIGYIISCSPTAMRLSTGPIKKLIDTTATILDMMGEIPPPPKGMGGESLTQLLNEGRIAIEVDEKYPQAIAISGILDRTQTFGNFDWDILINENINNPFFTSDFPVAIEQTENQRIINRIAPLAPDLAVRIRPSLEDKRRKGDFRFQHFRSRSLKLSHHEVCKINTLIVQCAEELVFFRDAHEWVEPFIRKNAGFHIEPITKTIPMENGELQFSKMCIVRRSE